MNEIINCIQVTDTIATSGQPTKEQFKRIADNGFDVVINLAMHNRGALKKEDKIVTQNGMIYYHIPILWEQPSKERLQIFLQTLKMLQEQGKKVFIHCILNHRVSVFIYHYKKSILKQNDAKLIAPKDFVPNEIWQAFIELDVNV
jgi:protein tyrosine phosphatase (PTP) superfamily phosphohydrolase (DUF442 family)